jgi:hypothetical protein
LLDGYIKLSRSILEKPVFQNERLFRVWVWCLMKATHTPYKQQVGLRTFDLEPGQFITGRFAGAEELGLAPTTFWRQILWLKNNESIDIKTDTKFSLITIVNWRVYQVQEEQKRTTKRTTNGQQTDTNKNGKNDITICPYGHIVSAFSERCPSLPRLKELTDARKEAIKRIWRRHPDPAIFEVVFSKTEASDFLSGRSGKWTNCNLDWLLNYKNFIKVLEGNYDNRITVDRQELPPTPEKAWAEVQEKLLVQQIKGATWSHDFISKSIRAVGMVNILTAREAICDKFLAAYKEVMRGGPK